MGSILIIFSKFIFTISFTFCSAGGPQPSSVVTSSSKLSRKHIPSFRVKKFVNYWFACHNHLQLQ